MSRADSERTRFFEQLAATYRGRLWRIARAYGRAEADDLLQEILLQLWRALPALREPAHAGTWCYRIALNTAITWQRRRRRAAAVQCNGQIVDDATSRPTDGGDLAAMLARFSDSLGEVDRALLLLLLEDVDYAAMAQIVGLSEGTLRVRIHRLKQKLANWEPLDS